MQKDENIYLLTGDLGYGILDNILKDFPNRAFNVGAAEQLLVGTAIGLAQEGKIPICYSITPFLLYRPFELIRNYLNHEKAQVKLVGSGRGKEYEHDGISHWCEDDEDIMNNFDNVVSYYPDTKRQIVDEFDEFLYDGCPAYLSLSRF